VHSVHRQILIRELDATLEQVEYDRGNLVCITEDLFRIIRPGCNLYKDYNKIMQYCRAFLCIYCMPLISK